MPCHHALAEALHAYIAAAEIDEDREGWLFRTSRGHNGSALSEHVERLEAERPAQLGRGHAAGTELLQHQSLQRTSLKGARAWSGILGL
jgi:hypothetical protein